MLGWATANHMTPDPQDITQAWETLTPLDSYTGTETSHLKVITWDQLVQIAHYLPPTPLNNHVKHPPPHAAAVRLAAEFFSVADTDILGQSRRNKHSLPRKMACLLMRDVGEMSYDEIGHVLNRDHTTILYLVRSAQEMIDDSPSNRAVYVKMREVLKKFVDKQKYGQHQQEEEEGQQPAPSDS